MGFKISREGKLFLLKTARNSIKDKLYGSAADCGETPEDLDFRSGCFVTIHLRKRLRGCIGNFRDDIGIVENVKDMARQAAFADPRFGPVSKDEFAMCELEISVLSPMIPAAAEEIKVGRDGIYIIKGYNRGVLLPQVAKEHYWDRETFLEQTCVKAGLPQDAYKDKDTTIFRFEALVFGDGDLYRSEE
ncbi:MAG: AmmeMemoRadiSam system protein A [Deferribacterales bacterium]